MKQRRKQMHANPAGLQQPSTRAVMPGPVLDKPKHRLSFRIVAALLIPCLILCLLEAVLHLAGYGYPTSFFVPYKIQGRRVYVENQKFGWRFFDPEMARTPQAVVLSAPKPPDVFRIFVLGESAAFGDPQPDFGLARMLQVMLSERYPGTRFEVVNAAMTAINSHVLLPIARGCAAREADMLVVYMGNNEVIGPFGSGTVFDRQAPSLAVVRATIELKSTRIGELLSGIIRRLRGRPAEHLEWGGMTMFLKNRVRADDPRLAATYSQFERNLRDILHAGIRHHARIVVSTVASNLRDCAPFASEHRLSLTDSQLADWERLYRSGCERRQAGDDAGALEFFLQAARLDDRFAELQFFWGTCCLRLKRLEEARTHLQLARDYDALRFRADSGINDIIRRVAAGRQREGILLCDGERILSEQSPDGVPGQELLYEHVHLTFEGNYLLALGIAKNIADLLPPEIAQGRVQGSPADLAVPKWPSAAECARGLMWTDWNRYEGLAAMMTRVNDPPFTTQASHTNNLERLREEMERLLPSIQPGSLHEFARQYRQALQAATNDWVLYKNLAGLQERLGEFAGAAESWQRVTQFLPHEAEAGTALALARLKAGQTEGALAEARRALALKPGSAAALNAYGLVLVAEKRFLEAIRQYEKALKLNPDSPETKRNLAAALIALGRNNEALEHLRGTLERKPNNAQELVQLGKMCLSQGWLLEAITNFNQALALEPTDATAHFCLGGALAMARQWPEARSQYAEAVRLKPDYPEARLGLGIELGRAGQHEAALEQFAEAVKLNPQLLEARLNLGIALAKAQRTGQAISQFQKALEMDPGNALALKYLQQLRPGN